MKLKYYILFLVLAVVSQKTEAQYPVFSQFYTSPLNLNPALAGNSSANWRVIGNQRNQWIASGTEPLTTMALSVDGKLFRLHNNENNYIGGGLLFTQDKALEGAYKNSSINMILSSHVALDEADNNGLSAGLGFDYNTTYIDYAALSFPAQLSSAGFNRSLPTNEVSLSSIKPYFSMFAGVVYNYSSERSEFEIGVSGYRFIKTNRSALNNPNQLDPPMYNLHAAYQTYVTDRMVLNTNGMYTTVNNQHFYNIGLNIGNIITMDEEEAATVLNTGIWLRNGEAVVPFVGLMYKNVQGGISYDVNLPSSNNALSALRTFEFSLIVRSPVRKGRPIPCPWK
jgi:type IX secretion system PorP/SprF family membrane protein